VSETAPVLSTWEWSEVVEAWVRCAGGSRPGPVSWVGDAAAAGRIAADVRVGPDGSVLWRTWAPDETDLSGRTGRAATPEEGRVAADAHLVELGWTLPAATDDDLAALLGALDGL